MDPHGGVNTVEPLRQRQNGMNIAQVKGWDDDASDASRGRPRHDGFDFFRQIMEV